MITVDDIRELAPSLPGAADPATSSTILHLDGHPIVLVDPEVIEMDEARELITDPWRLRAPRRLVDRSEQARASGG